MFLHYIKMLFTLGKSEILCMFIPLTQLYEDLHFWKLAVTRTSKTQSLFIVMLLSWSIIRLINFDNISSSYTFFLPISIEILEIEY